MTLWLTFSSQSTPCRYYSNDFVCFDIGKVRAKLVISGWLEYGRCVMDITVKTTRNIKGKSARAERL